MTRVLTTSAGVPIVAATNPAQIDDVMCTMWQSGRPVLCMTKRFTVSYVVRSPVAFEQTGSACPIENSNSKMVT